MNNQRPLIGFNDRQPFALILFIVFILSVPCLTSAQKTWVVQHPVDPDHYIGIGQAKKVTASPDHIERARDMALSQIAASIAVTITGETSHHVLEQAGIVIETFESNVSTMARAELEGYELFDTWETNTEYWVYYRLSKTRYHEMLERKQSIAAIQAHEYYSNGQDAIGNGHIVLGLSYFLLAANKISDFRGMGLEISTTSSVSFIDVDIFVDLRNLLSSIRIISHPEYNQANLFEAPEKNIKLIVSYLTTSGELVPVSNMPLASKIIQGNCNYNRIQPTDDRGNASLEITQTLSTENIQIQVFPDIKAISGINVEKLEQNFFSDLSLPNRVLSVHVTPVRVVVSANEENLGSRTSHSIVANNLKQHLTYSGWTVTNDELKSDYILQINASTRAGTELHGLYTAFATGNIALKKVKTNEVIFTWNIDQTNGGGLNFESAGIQALERLAEQMISGINDIIK